MKLRVKLGQESIINFLLADISITAIKFFIVQSIPGMYVYNNIANVIISCILLVFLIPAVITVYRSNSKLVILSSMFMLLTLIIQFMLFPNNIGVILNYLPKIVGMSYGGFIAGCGLTLYEDFYIKLARVSKIIILFGGMQFVAVELFGVVGVEKLNYNMSFGYFLVIPALMQFSKFITEKGKDQLIALLYSCATILMVLILGSRGAILAIAIGILFICLVQIELYKIKDFILSFWGVSIFLGLLVNSERIADKMYQFLDERNMNSRFLTMFLYGNIASTSARDELQNNVIDLIKKHPLIGNGMLSNLSSHNVFFEAMLFWGIPVGVLLIVIILFQWSKPLFLKDKTKKIVMLIFLAYAVTDSMLNLTVLGKDIFWIYLGMAIATKVNYVRMGRNEYFTCG